MPPRPQGGAPKSMFIEIRKVWCLSLRLDAYCSAETFFWRTDHHGARGSPQRAPLMGPHPTSSEIHLCMVSIDSSRCLLSIYNIVLENRPSCRPGEPPRCTPNGAPPDFHRNTPLYVIDRFVSMHTLNLQHFSGEPTIMDAVAPKALQMGPHRASLWTYSTSVLVGIAPNC